MSFDPFILRCQNWCFFGTLEKNWNMIFLICEFAWFQNQRKCIFMSFPQFLTYFYIFRLFISEMLPKLFLKRPCIQILPQFHTNWPIISKTAKHPRILYLSFLIWKIEFLSQKFDGFCQLVFYNEQLRKNNKTHTNIYLGHYFAKKLCL